VFVNIRRECPHITTEIQFSFNLTRITGTLHEKQYTFLITSGLILLRMRNVPDKSYREGARNLFSENFPRKSCRLRDNVESLGRLG